MPNLSLDRDATRQATISLTNTKQTVTARDALDGCKGRQYQSIRGRVCYEAIGPIRSMFDEILPRIDALVRERESYIFEDCSTLPARLIEIYLLGWTTSLLSATVLMICKNKLARKRGAKCLEESKILPKYVKIAAQSEPPVWAKLEVKIPYDSGTEPRIYPPVQFVIPRGSDQSIYSAGTIGGLVKLGSSFYGLTAQHIFASMEPSSQEPANSDGSDEDDEDLVFVADITDDDLTAKHVPKIAQAKELSTSNREALHDGRLFEDWGILSPLCATKTSEDLDWTLIEPASKLNNSVFSNSAVTSYFPRQPCDSEVNVMLPRGAVAAYLSTTPALWYPEQTHGAQKVWRLELKDLIKPGDCGAWVINSIYVEVYGQIVAVSPDGKIAYAVSMRDVANDIKRTLDFNAGFLSLKRAAGWGVQAAGSSNRGRGSKPAFQQHPAPRLSPAPALRQNNQKLIRACRNGEIEEARKLIDGGCDVNVGTPGTKPLLESVYGGFYQITLLLLQSGARPNCEDMDETPLFLASRRGDLETVTLLLDHEADVNGLRLPLRNPLSWAGRNGHIAVVKLLLERKALVDLRDDSGYTPLSWAARNGYERIVQLLLDNGASVNSFLRSELSPLWRATDAGHTKVVELLIQNKANINSMNERAQTALMNSIQRRDRQSTELLVSSGANVSSMDWSKNTALSLAAEGELLETVELLLKYGANLDTVNSSGNTPLAIALGKKNEALVSLLLSHGADINIADSKGDTVLLLACRSGDVSLILDLLGRGAKVNVSNSAGDTPLLLSVEQRHREPVARMLNSGANTNIANSRGQTPLLHALKHEDRGLVTLLLDHGADANFTGYQTPLKAAFTRMDKSLIELLLQHGADPMAVDNHGTSNLAAAMQVQATSAVRLLVARAKALNTMSLMDFSLMLPAVASFANSKENTKILLDLGFDPNTVDESRRTALFYADDIGTATWLLEKGTVLDHIDRNNRTALFSALQMKHYDVASLLLERGATTEVKDKSGRSLLSWACTPDMAEAKKAWHEKRSNITARVAALRRLAKRGGPRGFAGVLRELLQAGLGLDSRDINGRTPLSWAVDGLPATREIAQALINNGADLDCEDTSARSPRSRAVDAGTLSSLKLQKDATAVQKAAAAAQKDAAAGESVLMGAMGLSGSLPRRPLEDDQRNRSDPEEESDPDEGSDGLVLWDLYESLLHGAGEAGGGG